MIESDAEIERVAPRQQPPPLVERRSTVRTRLRDVGGSMSWRGDSGDVACEVSALNISGGGAAFASDVLPPPGIPLWLWLGAGAPPGIGIDAVASRLVTTSIDPSEMRIAHIQFVVPCPMDLFELAVDGPG
jgi:hypothetical protein